MAQPNLTENPGPGQSKSGQWGPPIAPIKGQGNCTHKRPRKRRNRVCRECGYFTVEQARRGGIRSGMMRRFNSRKRDSRIRNLRFKRGLAATAIAEIVGVSVRTVYYVLQRPAFWKLTIRQQATARVGCATNIFASGNADGNQASGVRLTLVKLLWWRRVARGLQRDAAAPRDQRRFDRLARRCSAQVGRYCKAIRQTAGVEQADAVRAASAAYFDRLWASETRPVWANQPQ